MVQKDSKHFTKENVNFLFENFLLEESNENLLNEFLSLFCRLCKNYEEVGEKKEVLENLLRNEDFQLKLLKICFKFQKKNASLAAGLINQIIELKEEFFTNKNTNKVPFNYSIFIYFIKVFPIDFQFE